MASWCAGGFLATTSRFAKHCRDSEHGLNKPLNRHSFMAPSRLASSLLRYRNKLCMYRSLSICCCAKWNSAITRLYVRVARERMDRHVDATGWPHFVLLEACCVSLISAKRHRSAYDKISSYFFRSRPLEPTISGMIVRYYPKQNMYEYEMLMLQQPCVELYDGYLHYYTTKIVGKLLGRAPGRDVQVSLRPRGIYSSFSVVTTRAVELSI